MVGRMSLIRAFVPLLVIKTPSIELYIDLVAFATPRFITPNLWILSATARHVGSILALPQSESATKECGKTRESDLSVWISAGCGLPEHILHPGCGLHERAPL